MNYNDLILYNLILTNLVVENFDIDDISPLRSPRGIINIEIKSALNFEKEGKEECIELELTFNVYGYEAIQSKDSEDTVQGKSTFNIKTTHLAYFLCNEENRDCIEEFDNQDYINLGGFLCDFTFASIRTSIIDAASKMSIDLNDFPWTLPPIDPENVEINEKSKNEKKAKKKIKGNAKSKKIAKTKTKKKS